MSEANTKLVVNIVEAGYYQEEPCYETIYLEWADAVAEEKVLNDSREYDWVSVRQEKVL